MSIDVIDHRDVIARKPHRCDYCGEWINKGEKYDYQKHCRGCPHLDFNEMSDEMYCKLKDFELIRLRWHKQRPDWCPLVKRKGVKNERND